MGGQETLLLVARFPRLLAGAAAFDAPTNMARATTPSPSSAFGATLQERARIEIGGTPLTDRAATAAARRLGAADRVLGRAAPDLVEHGRPDRDGPGAASRARSTARLCV